MNVARKVIFARRYKGLLLVAYNPCFTAITRLKPNHVFGWMYSSDAL
jgi:hypothetical protein